MPDRVDGTYVTQSENSSQPEGTGAQSDPPLGWFIYTVKQLELGLRSPLETVTQQAGLSTGQFTALSVLSRWPGITSSELARRSFVRAQTMAETITPLLESGHVSRAQDKDHGRRFLLYITEAGTEALASIRTPLQLLESEFLAELSPSERQLFAHFLRRCRGTLPDLPR